MLQQFGLGLAVAILLDAVIIRSLIVPAALQMLGRRAWWLRMAGAEIAQGVRQPRCRRPAGQLPDGIAGLLLTASRAFTEGSGSPPAPRPECCVLFVAAVPTGLMPRHLRIDGPSAGDPHAAARVRRAMTPRSPPAERRAPPPMPPSVGTGLAPHRAGAPSPACRDDSG